MPQFTKPSQRLTPYSSFRFQVKFEGRYVAGVTKVSGLARSTQGIRHRDGADVSTVRLAPGQTEYSPIMLERGVSNDPDFVQWASKVFDYANTPTGMAASLGDFRRPLSIEIYNEAGQKVIAYDVQDTWVSAFAAGAELDGQGAAIVIESITLQHQGWERVVIDKEVEPNFNLPTS